MKIADGEETYGGDTCGGHICFNSWKTLRGQVSCETRRLVAAFSGRRHTFPAPRLRGGSAGLNQVQVGLLSSTGVQRVKWVAAGDLSRLLHTGAPALSNGW